MLIVELNVAGYRLSGEMGQLAPQHTAVHAIQPAIDPVADAAAPPDPRSLTDGR